MLMSRGRVGWGAMTVWPRDCQPLPKIGRDATDESGQERFGGDYCNSIFVVRLGLAL